MHDCKWIWLSFLVEDQFLYRFYLICFAISWWHWNGEVMRSLDYKGIKTHVMLPDSWMCKSLSRIRVFTRIPELEFCADTSIVAFICYKMNRWWTNIHLVIKIPLQFLNRNKSIHIKKLYQVVSLSFEAEAVWAVNCDSSAEWAR